MFTWEHLLVHFHLEMPPTEEAKFPLFYIFFNPHPKIFFR